MRTIAAEWSPWLTVLAEARQALDDPLWARAVPAGAQGAVSFSVQPAPLLHDATLTVDAARTDRFVRRLFGVAGESGESAVALRAAAGGARLEAPGLLEAAIRQDVRCLDGWAARLGVEPLVLRTVAAVAVTPLLHACRRVWKDGPLASWRHGYCPVCGAWPTFAEARGLEHSRQLRCARCGGDWRTDWLRCPYCDNADHTRLGALVVADAPLETRKVDTCEACRGYVKSITTLRATPVDEVALVDLDTVELDIAALQRGYARPEEPACLMRTRVVGGRSVIRRPADLCRELLAALEAFDGRRRRRKRDTTPDALGMAIKRELLERAVAEDPAPEAFQAWLLEQCLAGAQTYSMGAVRAMALEIHGEYQLTAALPAFEAWLASGAPSEDRDAGG